MKKVVIITVYLSVSAAIVITAFLSAKKKVQVLKAQPLVLALRKPSTTPIPTAALLSSPTPTVLPTTKPKTFEEINREKGPCVKVTVLMYHHIQDTTAEMDKGEKGLSVSPKIFKEHIQYLKDEGYQIIPLKDINDFFNGGGIAKKAVAITLDDAYDDNYSQMFPIVKEMGVPVTVFTPTGLVDNPGYLTWGQIEEMKNSGLVYFGNHTWSHQSSYTGKSILEREISTADSQLNEKNLNFFKIFAYPYGSTNAQVQEILNKDGYNLAFTTNPGTLMCAKERLALPRIRMGSGPLSRSGL